ncbi:MAG: AsmA-like C-terminal region-containing protein [Bacteroidota bacterium]|nr:AsmA-like C-terminal region-containing protein [Bacteroidota bacterium]
MKILKRILLILLAILILFSVAISVILITKKDDIKQMVIQEINNNIKTELLISDIKLGVFKSFPKVSIVIDNVKVKELPAFGNDYLAEIEKIYLSMDLIGFLKKEYIIEKLSVDNGKVNLKINKKNENNYIIWDIDVEEKESKPIKLDLQKIQFNNINIQYKNDFDNQIIAAELRKIDFKGDFLSDNYSMSMKATTFIDSLLIDNVKYIDKNHLDIESEFQIDKNTYFIKKSNIALDDLNILLDGTIKQQLENNYELDINIESKEISISDLLYLVPKKYSDSLQAYEAEGEFLFNGSINGQYSDKKLPGLNIDFAIEKASIKRKESNESLKHIQVKGKFYSEDLNNLKTSYAEITKFSTKLGRKEIIGNFKISDFDDPLLETKLSSNISLRDLNDLLNLKGIKKFNGDVFIDAKLKAKLEDIKNNKINDKTSVKVRAIFDRVDIQFENSDIEYKDISGNFHFNGQDLIIKDYRGYISNTHFELNGIAKNFLAYLFSEDEKLVVKSKFNSKHIQIDDFLKAEEEAPKQVEKTTESTENMNFVIPKNIKFELLINCKEAVYNNLITKNIKGKVSLSEAGVILDDLKLETADGMVELNGRLFEEKSNQLSVDGIIDLKGIDISKLLKQLDNLGQDVITHNNIHGKIDSRIKLNSIFNPDLSPDLDKLFVTTDLSIKNGELINFEPITKVLGFVKIKKMKRIEFDEIQNTILISNKLITIPVMDINSNAFSMSVSGEHKFNNEIDYMFKINLSHLFFGKYDYNKNDLDFDENVGKGGVNLYVSMTGTIDDPVFKRSKVESRKKFKENMEKEKKEFNNIFKKEKKKKAEEEFEFEWEEE